METEPVIVLAEDDEDDCLLVREALQQTTSSARLVCVKDGEELLEYVRNGRTPPSLIVIDLNMPRRDCREALKHIKSDPDLRHLPVVVLTTSRSPEDVQKCYDAGVNAYMRKPKTFHEFVNAVANLYQYWFGSAELPS